MTRGKQICKRLKEIRRQIAEANDIEFMTSECRYKGDCLGTCPKCEAEVRYLEQQLRSRSLAGKAVALAGISAGMILMSGCSGTSSKQPSETLQGEPVEIADTLDFEGEIEMLRFIGQHLKYPEEQLKEGIQGRVVVQFYVDTLGRVCEPRIVRGKDSALDREALRVVRLFPNFTPGTINGKKVNTYFTLPITFKLPAD